MVEKKDTSKTFRGAGPILISKSARSLKTEKARWDGVTPILRPNPLFRWRDKLPRGARGAILGLFYHQLRGQPPSRKREQGSEIFNEVPERYGGRVGDTWVTS